MYSNEGRMKVIRLYIEYDYNARAVIRELVYPSRNRLAIWYKEYQKHGTLDGLSQQNNSKYWKEQRQEAVVDRQPFFGQKLRGQPMLIIDW